MRTITPKILYVGTPVAFISSLNADGSTNLAPRRRRSVPDLETAQFHTEKRKFEAAGFSRCASERVTPERAAECPFQMEARVLALHEMGGAKRAELDGGLGATFRT